MMASKNPVRAPRDPSVIERLLKVRRPWPVRMNPVYAIATVQKIVRPFMPPHLGGIPNIVAKWLVPPEDVLRAGETAWPELASLPFAIVDVNRWGERSGLRPDAVGSQVIEGLEAQEIRDKGDRQ
jgi:hypothetical protein